MRRCEKKRPSCMVEVSPTEVVNSGHEVPFPRI